MLKWIRIEWLRLKAMWAWLTLTPLARQAVRNATPETIRKIDAILETRREHTRPPRGG